MKRAYLFVHGRILTEIHAHSKEEARDRAARLTDTDVAIMKDFFESPSEFRAKMARAEIKVVDLPTCPMCDPYTGECSQKA